MTISMKCELLINCAFFTEEMKNERIAEQFKQRYCDNCKDACARYMIARGAGLDFIPDYLYPNEYEKALEILNKK